MYTISHKRKFIFIHVPKVAGRSMSVLFQEQAREEAGNRFLHTYNFELKRRAIHMGLGTYKPGFAFLKAHASARQVKAFMWPNIYENYFKFGFVRNPWSRQVSMYLWLLKLGPRQRIYKRAHPVVTSFKDFNEFIFWYHTSGEAKFLQHWTVQKDFLFDKNGRQIVDFIGRFERLDEDFQYVLDKIGLPEKSLQHRNKSGEKKSYRDYYNDASIELIAQVCKPDIETFGYTF